MIEQLSDYIGKYDVPGSQGKHCGNNNNRTGGCLALVEYTAIGKKDYRKETTKALPRQGQNSVTTIKLYLGLGSSYSCQTTYILHTFILNVSNLW